MQSNLQFEELRERFADCLLLFQVDDFLYVFADHADRVGLVCGIYVENNGHGRVAGFSRLTAPRIIRQLVNAGYRVAVAHRDRLQQQLN